MLAGFQNLSFRMSVPSLLMLWWAGQNGDVPGLSEAGMVCPLRRLLETYRG